MRACVRACFVMIPWPDIYDDGEFSWAADDVADVGNAIDLDLTFNCDGCYCGDVKRKRQAYWSWQYERVVHKRNGLHDVHVITGN